MTTSSPDPRGTHRHSRPLLAATALTALLALSACGSSGDEPSSGDTSSAGSSTSASPSASPSPTTSPSATNGSASATPAPPTASTETTQAEDASKPQPTETRMASAPEVGMPTASPFDKEKADQQAANAVCNASNLSGSAAPSNGAAGHTITTLTLTNKGSRPAPSTATRGCPSWTRAEPSWAPPPPARRPPRRRSPCSRERPRAPA